jgi:GTPase SAR1 family protein
MAKKNQKKDTLQAPHHSVKVVLLGDSGVGKTSVALRLVRQEFHPFQEATIGASFLSQVIQLPGDVRVELKIWDTAGQERYQSLTPLYFRGAGAAILMYDICRQHSFQTLQRWVRELRNFGPNSPSSNSNNSTGGDTTEDRLEDSSELSASPVVLAVCGNKSDLDDHRTIDRLEAQQYAHSVGAFYMETSARNNENIEELFTEIARQCAYRANPRSENSGTVDLSASNNDSSTKSKCCST